MVEQPIKLYVAGLAKRATEAARLTARASASVKDQALARIAERLEVHAESILEANKQDRHTVARSMDKEAAKAATERIGVTADHLDVMVDRVRRVLELPDPIGSLSPIAQRPNGMQLHRMRMPIGVIAIISELGPASLLDAMTLCLKAGNVSMSWGSDEWTQTITAIRQAVQEAVAATEIPLDAVTVLERTEREAALELMRLPQYVQAVIARGGPGLRKAAIEQAKMPVLCHDGGLCRIYVDEDADLTLAQNLVVNSKAQDFEASNGVDTVVVHQAIARPLLPALVRRLLDEFKVDVLGCPRTIALTGSQQLTGYKSVLPAAPEDWGRKLQGRVLGIKTVADMDEALGHLAQYGPGLTDVIVTRQYRRATRFVREVDAATVMVNASTRLHEGDQFGFGPEVGFGTGRTHARGPITLEQLTSEKYVVLGTGQLRHPHPVPVTYEDAIMLKRPLG